MGMQPYMEGWVSTLGGTSSKARSSLLGLAMGNHDSLCWMIPVPYGAQRDEEPSVLGTPLGAHAASGDVCHAVAEGV